MEASCSCVVRFCMPHPRASLSSEVELLIHKVWEADSLRQDALIHCHHAMMPLSALHATVDEVLTNHQAWGSCMQSQLQPGKTEHKCRHSTRYAHMLSVMFPITCIAAQHIHAIGLLSN